MMHSANRDYREILREAYQARVEKNPQYSLRAFARDLNVAPSRVVEVLNYKRGLSRIVASRMAQGLGLNGNETEIFLNLVDSIHGRTQNVRSRANKSLNQIRSHEYTVLQVDAFKLVSDWYHYAILELTTLDGFQNEEKWISKRLSVPLALIRPAMKRLKRLGLLIETSGKLQAVEAMTFSTTDVPSDALKKHHAQLLGKAQEAIYDQPVDRRDLSAMTMAIRHSDLPRAKEMIKSFRRELSRELEAQPKKDSVYCLAIQFFQLDKNQENTASRLKNPGGKNVLK